MLPKRYQTFDLSQANVQLASKLDGGGGVIFAVEPSLHPRILGIRGNMVSDDAGGGIEAIPYMSEQKFGTGNDHFTGSATGIGRIFDVATIDLQGTPKLLFATSEGVYTKVIGAAGTEATVATWTGDVSEATIVPFKGDHIIFPYSDNSADTAVRASDGSDVGIDRPEIDGGQWSDVVTITSVATGELEDDQVRGVVKYYISFIDSDGDESALSEIIGTHDAGDGDSVKITIDTTDSGDFDTNDEIQLYRTFAGREQAYAIPTGRIPITGHATNDTFTDQTADASLGELPLWHGDPPPKYVVDAIPYAGRLLALAEDNQTSPEGTKAELFIADPNEEGSWWITADGNRISVDNDGGDEGVALIPWGQKILIAMKDHFYLFSGKRSDAFRIDPFKVTDPRDPSVGLPNKSSYALTESGMYFYYNGEIHYLTLSGSKRIISDPIKIFLETSSLVALGISKGILRVSIDRGDTLLYSLNDNKWLGRRASLYDTGWSGPQIALSIPERYVRLGQDSELNDLIGICRKSPVLTWTESLHYYGGYRSTLGSNTDQGSHRQAGTPSTVLGPFFGDDIHPNKNFLYIDVVHSLDNAIIKRERMNIGLYGEFLVIDITGVGSGSTSTINAGINRWYVSDDDGLTYDKSANLTGTYVDGRILSITVAFQTFDADSQ